MRHARRGNGVGLMVTLALHAGVLAAVGFAHNAPQAPIIERRDFVAAELVKLGKPREKFWLPRITQPPRAEAPKPALKVADDPNAAPAPKEAPRPEDPKVSKQVKNALTRARTFQQAPEEPEEGSATGSNLGTASQATGDPYQAEFIGLMRQNYNLPPGIAPDQIPVLPKIVFTITPEGTIANVKLIKSSGNNFVDDACVQAAELTRKLPPPPPKWRSIRIPLECEK